MAKTPQVPTQEAQAENATHCIWPSLHPPDPSAIPSAAHPALLILMWGSWKSRRWLKGPGALGPSAIASLDGEIRAQGWGEGSAAAASPSPATEWQPGHGHSVRKPSRGRDGRLSTLVLNWPQAQRVLALPLSSPPPGSPCPQRAGFSGFLLSPLGVPA